jgi:D-inositol-3-phosphate glycosyltransferase
VTRTRVAIVTLGFRHGGGVPAVARFLYEAMSRSDRYEPHLISLATSALDPLSVRLIAPRSWRGVRARETVWEGLPLTEVGAFLPEVEFQRYQPRRILTTLLRTFDLIQVVAGTPLAALAVADAGRPTCSFVATLTAPERAAKGPNGNWRRAAWSRAMTAYVSRLEPLALSRIDHVFAESRYSESLLRPIIPSASLSVAVPGVDTALFHPAETSRADYVLATGRFGDPRKNVRLLFEAFALVKRNLRLAHGLLLVGQTPPSNDDWAFAAKLGIDGSTVVRCNVPTGELADLYRNAAAFVLTSREEGLPLVMLEAMASGIPVVATRCGGPETIIADGDTGFLVPGDDAPTMAERVEQLLVDRTMATQMGSRAREVVVSEYSLKRSAQRYFAKYEELLGRPPRSPRPRRPRVLIFLEYYLPGFKAGGPLRSISSLVSRLGDEFDFRIITRCHDQGEQEPYPNVRIDDWNPVGSAQVCYASRRSLAIAGLVQMVQHASPDMIYINGFFGPMAVRLLVARRRGLVPQLPIIIAPRGEFSPGALLLKAVKKRLYLRLADRTGLYDGIVWQASSPLEEADIRNTVGADACVKVAGDMFPQLSPSSDEPRLGKRPGSVHFVFLSRISRKKNLDFALQLLSSLDGDVAFDIYGPIDDATYWAECEACIRRLPSSVHATYRGAVPHHAVAGVLARAHFFILPTRGENFGHAILEALTAGCPALVSDQTPWFRSGNAAGGLSIPLDDVEQWRRELQKCIDMDQDEYRSMSMSTQRAAQIERRESPAATQNKQMLDELLAIQA